MEETHFQDMMDKVVRVTLNNETECFEEVLERVLNDFRDGEFISWPCFLGFFSKRGKMRAPGE